MNKRLFSGIQPSGDPHIGNYLGAIRQWIPLQDEYEAFFSIVDLHAITVPQDPTKLRKKTLEVAKIYLAAGIDPSKATLFVQSHVPEHTELMWILNTITRNGDLTKMTQFKNKSGLQFGFEEIEREIQNLSNLDIKTVFTKATVSSDSDQLDVINHVKNSAVNPIYDKLKILLDNFRGVGVGLFDYPVLMAADILMFQSDVVPVGKDQKQHVEICRDAAGSFNATFGETFKLPEPLIQADVATIPGLDGRKMSKSYGNSIEVFLPSKALRKKIMTIQTDSKTMEEPKDPDTCNVFNLYKLFASPEQTADLAARYRAGGLGYGHAKQELFEVMDQQLQGPRARYEELKAHPEQVFETLSAGAERARAVARTTMALVRDRIGL